MSIRISTTQLGCNGDYIEVAYSEEGNVELSMPLGRSQATLTVIGARDLAAALYGLAYLA